MLKDYNKREANKREREARGVTTRPHTTNQQNHKDFQDVYKNWQRDKSFFPKEYIPYFENNDDALADYCSCYAWKIQHERGEVPYFAPMNYDQRNFDAFDGFRYRWGWKIEQYNKNGEYYY